MLVEQPSFNCFLVYTSIFRSLKQVLLQDLGDVILSPLYEARETVYRPLAFLVWRLGA